MLIRISLFAVIIINTAFINAQDLGVIPVPREIEYSKQHIMIDGVSSIAISSNNSELSEYVVPGIGHNHKPTKILSGLLLILILKMVTEDMQLSDS